MKIGDKVKIKRDYEAYYSGYGGNRICYMTPKDTGIIGSIKSPKVRKYGHGAYFCCIDFEKYEQTWRTAVDYCDIVKLK